jgi:hypothetical protein
MPVDQTGENILYVVDKEATTVETHIQIQYEGEASRFAWVLPVQSLPTFEVGSQPLFSALLQGSVPTYGFNNQFNCTDSNAFGGTGGSGGGFGSAGDGGGAGSGGSGGPAVVYQKTVGAFDVVVLQGGTAKEVIDWLHDNQYQQNPAAEPILQKYLEKNYLFAAIKLTGGAGVDEIHPLVVKYSGTQPCIPLELTRIAAVENMGVRAFFLGKERWVPSGGYKHIVLNPARLDWLGFGANYVDVLSKAADSAVANGRAFATEYAGPSAIVNKSGIFSPAWSAAPFSSAQPEQVSDLLLQQGLLSCFTDFSGKNICSTAHPLLPSLLDEFLPAPQGVEPGEFYACLACYSDQIDPLKWDGAAFAQRFDERIVQPGKHAVDLLDKNPKLTRLFTTISPLEMTEDPEFHAHPTLGDVGTLNLATQRFECNHTVMQLPDSRQIALPPGGGWVPWTDEMPWVERIEELPASGDPIVLVSRTAKINELIDAWNQSQGWPPSTSGTGGAGGSDGFGGFGGSGDAGGSGTAGSGPSGSSGQSTGGAAGSGTAGSGTAGADATGAGGTGGSSAQGGVGGSSQGAVGGAGGGTKGAATPAKNIEPEGGGCQVGQAGGAGSAWLGGLLAGLLAFRRRKAVR